MITSHAFAPAPWGHATDRSDDDLGPCQFQVNILREICGRPESEHAPAQEPSDYQRHRDASPENAARLDVEERILNERQEAAEAAHAEGRAERQAEIVRWLKRRPFNGIAWDLADRIEKGEADGA